MAGMMKKLFCVFLLLVLTGLCGCMPVKEHAVSSFVFSNDIIGASIAETGLHMTDEANLSSVCRSGFYELFYERSNCSVSVLDVSQEKYWNCIPVFRNSSSAVLSAFVVSEKGRCYLNSQDNSVAFSSFSVDFDETGLTVTYYMSDNAETVKKSKSSLAENEILVIVPVRFTMADGNLTVKINCGDIYVSPGNVLEKLSLMPYFGAFGEPAKTVEAAADETADNAEDGAEEAQTEEENASDRDFLLVPDGCGAVMYTGENDEQTQNLSFEVYGNETGGARVGCFGVKKGQSAFVGIIDGGSETATVKAMRPAANADAVYTVYPEFSLTPVSIEDGKYIFAESYKGEISVTYKFLTGELCTYIEMASACREELIRSGMLSPKTLQSGVYPLNLSAVGSVDGTKKTRCTELEQAEDLLAVLKAKGVNSINLILDGFFENGLYTFDSGRVSIPGSLGGRKDLGGLCDYASTQSIDVYAGIDLLRTGSKLRAATSISGTAQKNYSANPLSPYIGGEGKYQYLISPVYIEKNVISFMNSLKKSGISGYASAAGGMIYPDYKTGVSKTDFIKLMKEHYASFAAQKKLLLRSADFCLIKNADVVTDVPFYTQNPESDVYEAVPFIPAVLHSTLVYSGSPANEGSIYTLELLKSVEYGACPYVRWIYDARSPLFYELNFSEISEFYSNALKKLGDLSSQRITAHRKVEEGLYETTYSGGSIVYVNYNNHSVNVDNISVPPYDYLRIN